MRGKTVEEVCELLADINGMLTFLLKPSNNNQHNLFASAELHVDPNDDEFIPCRELGLAFSYCEPGGPKLAAGECAP